MSLWSLLLCIVTAVQVSAAEISTESGTVDPPYVPFYPGEKLTYSVEYGFIVAGTAYLSVEGIDTLRGVPCYHFQSRALSNPTFSPIFTVDDRADSYMDIFRLVSLRMEKHLREGKYKKDFLVDFEPSLNLAYYPDGDTVETMSDTQDVLSALYYLRKQELKVGRTIAIPNHNNKKNYPLAVRVLRKERVKVPAGKFTCYLIEPFLQEEGIFKAKGKIHIWVTDDERKIPVLVRSSVIIGSVSAKLEEYQPGTPLDLELFARPAEPPAPDSLYSDSVKDDTPDSIEIGGTENDITPQDAGSQQDKDVSVQAAEEPGESP